MQGLILNRNKYIIEKSRKGILAKRAGIFVASITAIGLVLFFSLNNAYKTTVDNNIESGKSSNNVLSSDIGGRGDDDISLAQSEAGEIGSSGSSNDDNQVAIIRNSVAEKYLVTKVVDGDTIYVSGIDTRIRLIGVNTPETVSTSKPVQCFGPESSNYLKTLLLNKYVGLESDEASGDVDIYNRPLRYVYYNGENVNQKLILEGYGKEASYGTEYKYRSQFVASEKFAITNNKGLWSPNTCNGSE